MEKSPLPVTADMHCLGCAKAFIVIYVPTKPDQTSGEICTCECPHCGTPNYASLPGRVEAIRKNAE